jgi:hypothetical protein
MNVSKVVVISSQLENVSNESESCKVTRFFVSFSATSLSIASINCWSAAAVNENQNTHDNISREHKKCFIKKIR